MIISALNRKDIEQVLLDTFPQAVESSDNHLGRSWEVDGELPKIPGYVWDIKTLFGKKRALLKKAPMTQDELLQIVNGLTFVKSSIWGMTADFPISFNDVCKLPFVQRVKTGWTTLRATWDAPNGKSYTFRQAGRGAHWYSYICE